MTTIFSIADFASEFGVTTRTIRYYEDEGLISPSRKGQRRVYSARDRVRLKLIMRGKRLGFSLKEIREMVDMYDADTSEVAQLKLFLSKIKERRDALLSQREDIDSILSELDRLEGQSVTLLKEKQS
ncbi:MAG: MerR family DNA-binding transcriptional regulator [Alphaproteobacteria bacterium]|nr:MerR family DNA-binding transcriptional regulator [Rhodospirillales bacterium]MCW9046016.1 MerR family DNA-binding transcriptional regulator [Alphaproteobacteria bacterium]